MRIPPIYRQFQQVLSVYNKRDKEKLFLVALSQVFLAFLDLLGVALLGVIGALSVYGIQSKSPGNRINQLLEFTNLNQYDFQQQVAILGGIAAFVLIFKTVISVFLVRKTLLFVSRRGALISSKLIRDLFSKSAIDLNKHNNQEIIYSTTVGVENLTTRVIGSALMIFSDLVLLLVLFVGLLFINISISISIFLIFSFVALALNKYMKSSSYKLGIDEARLGVSSNESIIEALNSYRELVVKNRRSFYVEKITGLRMDLATVTAKKNFMPNLSKYAFEIALIIASFLIAGIQFALYNSSQAIASLAIFLAASTRIAPAILRIQQSTIYLRLGLGTVEKTLDMIDFARFGNHDELISTPKRFEHEDFQPLVDIKDLNFKYENNVNFEIRNLSLQITPGSQVAITGSSGAGKTTLVDLILGVFSNDYDSVKISGLTPLSAFARWPGAVAYVPQNINIMNATIRENVSQGYELDPADEARVWNSLRVAHLDEFVKSLPLGIDTHVGELGNQLSGGQRQRLGIARALFTSPKLLILDEATSALDGETEALISQTIRDLRGRCTVILIAHRLSSVINADKIILMENGEIAGFGNFAELQKNHKNFASLFQITKPTSIV
jgi:ABC-type multidrug transport system fused ATPase/permease subunit